jgi:hypothetical protein
MFRQEPARWPNEYFSTRHGPTWNKRHGGRDGQYRRVELGHCRSDWDQSPGGPKAGIAATDVPDAVRVWDLSQEFVESFPPQISGPPQRQAGRRPRPTLHSSRLKSSAQRRAARMEAGFGPSAVPSKRPNSVLVHRYGVSAVDERDHVASSSSRSDNLDRLQDLACLKRQSQIIRCSSTPGPARGHRASPMTMTRPYFAYNLMSGTRAGTPASKVGAGPPEGDRSRCQLVRVAGAILPLVHHNFTPVQVAEELKGG